MRRVDSKNLSSFVSFTNQSNKNERSNAIRYKNKNFDYFYL